jgi:dihydroorotase
MKPPLRTEADQKALIQGLKDGTIDAIASDHAPHAIEEKDVEYDAAAFGIVGLETSVGLILTHLVEKGILTLGQMLEKMSINPARILGLKSSHLLEGEAPSLTLIDPNLKWKVDKNRFLSKSRNTPFDGWEVKGKPVGVINHGQIFCPGID